MEFTKDGSIANLIALATPLTHDMVLEAVIDFEASGREVSSYSHSTTYDLLINGNRYPPKAIFGLALSKLTNTNIHSYHFSGGLKSPCFIILERLGFNIVPKAPPDESWSHKEIKGLVRVYLQLLLNENGKKFNKTEVCAALGSKYSRSPSSCEYLLRNISYVFEMLGRKWVTGLKPESNILFNQLGLIERYVSELDHSAFNSAVAYEAKVNSLLTSKLIDKPKGNNKPTNKAFKSYSFDRDPYVKAWVLQRAAGECECCNLPAPFKTNDGRYFLEVHHLIPLVDKGSDTVENCIGVCPNCHRMLHYGQNKESLRAKLIKLIEEKEAAL